METMTKTPRTVSKQRLWGTVIGYGVALAALVWVFHDINFALLRRDVSHVNWLLAFAGVVVDIGRYVSQSVRWAFLIRPIGKISFFRSFQSLYTGIFLNLLLPLRMGEVARAYIASQFAHTSFPSIFSSILAEYLIDGIWLAISVGIVALCVPLPPDIANAARILGVAVIIAMALFFVFVIRSPKIKMNGKASAMLWKPLIWVFSLIAKMRNSMQTIGRSPYFFAAIAVSSLDLLFHIVAFWIICIAYGIHIPFIVAAAIMLFVFVGLIIPNAPSNVGSFQFLCVVGLLAFGVDKTAASGFSVLFFLLVNIPQVILGWLMFAKSGQRLYDIKEKLAALRLSMKE